MEVRKSWREGVGVQEELKVRRSSGAVGGQERLEIRSWRSGAVGGKEELRSSWWSEAVGDQVRSSWWSGAVGGQKQLE